MAASQRAALLLFLALTHSLTLSLSLLFFLNPLPLTLIHSLNKTNHKELINKNHGTIKNKKKRKTKIQQKKKSTKNKQKIEQS